LGHDPADVAFIVVTHHHPDHTGSLRELRALTEAQVVAHAAETHLGRHGRARLSPGRHLGEWARRWLPRFLRLGGTRVDKTVQDGDVIPALEGLQVIHTPGHSPGSICLYLPERKVLFTGDLILNNGDRLSRPLPSLGTARRQYEESLRRVLALDFETACFSHGRPIIEGADERCRELIARPYDQPLWLIIARNLGRLAGFHVRLFRRHR